MEGQWKWLLEDFAATYGIRDTYTTLAHLLWVVRCIILIVNSLELFTAYGTCRAPCRSV